MNFEQALTAVKNGLKAARTGWNGKGMWLALVAPCEMRIQGEFHMVVTPWIGMQMKPGLFVPWVASQTDMLSDDWEIL
jgi:hypothetical protein